MSRIATMGPAGDARAWIGRCVAALVLVGLTGPWSHAATAVRVEMTDGTATEGDLVRIGGDVLVVSVGGAERSIALGEVRGVERLSPTSDSPPKAVRVDLVDGGWLDGDDLGCEGDVLTLARREGSVTLPVARVRDAAWRRSGDSTDPHPGAEWLATVPADAGSDLLVVAAADGQEFVECAVTGVTAEVVTVVLDEETIPVKRGKVLGIHWLRPAAATPRPGSVLVEVAGGSLRAGRVEWTSEGEVVLDGDLRLPEAAVKSLDWSAGRSVALVSVAPERTDVEPWFGGLADIPGLSTFFAPRVVPAAEGFPGAGLVLRPRTITVWRVPAEGRRFRAAIAPAAGGAAVGAATVAVAVDGREVARHHVDAATFAAIGEGGIPLDVDLSGVRRLTLSVDFAGPADLGCAVRLSSPVIDQ